MSKQVIITFDKNLQVIQIKEATATTTTINSYKEITKDGDYLMTINYDDTSNPINKITIGTSSMIIKPTTILKIATLATTNKEEEEEEKEEEEEEEEEEKIKEKEEEEKEEKEEEE